MSTKNHFRPWAVVVLLFFAQTALGQLTSDSVVMGRLVPRAEQIRLDLEASRYHLGPIRVYPQLLFRDLGYNSNVDGVAENPISDWTATVAAGARLTLPMGSKMYLRGTALPEYTWYADLADRRFLGGTYDASLVGLFNRLSIEGTAGTANNLVLVSSEIDALSVRERDDVRFDGELDVLRRLSLFGTVHGQRNDYDDYDDLDREERLVKAGVRYRFRPYLDFSIAREESEAEFANEPLERDNTSSATILGMHYDRERFYANFTVGARTGEAANGSTFPEYDVNTGSYFLSYSLSAPVEVQLLGHRHVVYGIYPGNPYFFESRNGAAILIHAGQRISFRASGEMGTNDYPVATGSSSAERFDDVVTYGGGVAFRLYRNISLTVGLTQTDYSSNFDEFDRSVVRIQSGLIISGGSIR